MPAKPLWLSRINEICEQLERLPRPFVDRATVETLLGVGRRRAHYVQAGLKSSLIMQEESTSARAGTIASDWYYLGRVRSFGEIQAAINSLTPARIVDYLRRYPPGDYTIVTLGPKPLHVARN